MRTKPIVHIDKGPDFRIEGGMVYVEDWSGGVLYRRVMSIGRFRLAIEAAQQVFADWEGRTFARETGAETEDGRTTH